MIKFTWEIGYFEIAALIVSLYALIIVSVCHRKIKNYGYQPDRKVVPDMPRPIPPPNRYIKEVDPKDDDRHYEVCGATITVELREDEKK